MTKSKKISLNDIEDVIVEKLNQNGEIEFTVTGNSMLPFFTNNKSRIVLKKPQNKLKRGDVVLYKNNNKWILHRILKGKKNSYIICGDALNTLEYINKKNIIAVVTKYCNKNKYISTKNFIYQIKINIWMLTRPIRKYIFKFYYFIKRKNDDNG